MRDVRRGPRAATRENPAGLTARELEVVALVAEGLRNAEIAGRLFVSEKTVAHHVSAILRKLDVATRSQAGAEAARLGHRRKIGSPPDVGPEGAHLRLTRAQINPRNGVLDDSGSEDSHGPVRDPAPQRLALARGPRRGRRALQERRRRGHARRHQVDPQLRARRGRRLGRHGLHLRGVEPRGDPQARQARRPAGRRDHRGRRHGDRAARSRSRRPPDATPGGSIRHRGRRPRGRRPRAAARPGSPSAAAGRARRRGRSRPTAARRR